MLQLVSGLDCAHYTPRHYVVGWDDSSSVEKVHKLESSLAVRRATTARDEIGAEVGAGTGAEPDVIAANVMTPDINSSDPKESPCPPVDADNTVHAGKVAFDSNASDQETDMSTKL
ncbi:hypothetical protein BGZ97_000051 [Linnemannia gamsii]|uniref:Uncharacterized protein n=1 Tax=Linnemannia gamsii TaxID=64522 RepID=A0A9P6UWS2_9FUNG|nr:hypothetical protein BGZ97_000051 [Linnemannia gamsii]